jgi:hypothetical protein
MAFAPLLDCKFPQDLEAAASQLEQEIGDRFNTSLNLLNEAEASAEGIDQLLAAACQTLSEIMVSGSDSSNIKTCNDVSEQFGLPKEDQTEEDDEELAFYAGIGLFDGVAYPINNSGNIDNLRRLYFAAGRSLDRTAAFLKESKTLVVHNKSELQTVAAKIPGKQNHTLGEIKDKLKASYLTEKEIHLNEDFSTQVLLRGIYLNHNKSEAETLKSGKARDYELATSVFHFGAVDTSVAAFRRYRSYGYLDERLSAILGGEDLSVLFPAFITDKLAANASKVSSIIQQLDFVLSRFDKIPEKNKVRNRLRTSINALQVSHQEVITASRFQVSVITETDTLQKLRRVHADSKIINLLENRPEVTGLNLDFEDADVFKMIQKAGSASPGSTLISNRYLARQGGEVFNTKTFLEMSSVLHGAILQLDRGIALRNFSECRVRLVRFLNLQPVLSPLDYVNTDGSLGNRRNPGDIYQGQPSMTTPSSILVEHLDTYRTFNFELRIKGLDELLAKIDNYIDVRFSRPVAAVIRLITNLFRKALDAITLLKNKARDYLFKQKKKIDAFMSQYLTLIGSGSFEASLLKCAINFDIGANFVGIEQLLALLESIANSVSNFVVQIARWVNDLLKNVLCLPANLINAFAGALNQKLPSFCTVVEIDLGDTLRSAMVDLRAIADLEIAAFTNFSKDLIHYRAMVNASPDRLQQFRADAVCNSGGVNQFFNSALLNIHGAVPTPPRLF